MCANLGGVIGLRIASTIAGTLMVVATMGSVLRSFVVPRGGAPRLTRAVFVTIGTVMGRIAHQGRAFHERDRVMATYAPIALLSLPLVWFTIVIAGFTMVHWGVDGTSLRESFLVSGSSMLTLGVVFRTGLPSATLTFLQSVIGIILGAILIAYLPTIYSAFSRRETLVGLLESRAGTPPSPQEMLTRYHRVGLLEEMDLDLFVRWEEWFMEIEESHTNIAALAFFRSPQPQRSWITAAGCVLDSASLYLSVVDRPFSARAALCLRTGFLSLRRLADFFDITVDHDPAPDDPITVTRAEFDEMCAELVATGIPVKADRDQAWRDFQGWRVNYDAALVGLATLLMAPEGRWSSDRVTGPTPPARLAGRRPRRRT